MVQELQEQYVKTGRKFIGIDKNPIYMHAAKKNNENKPVDTSGIENVVNTSNSKKIPFSNLLKKGLINPERKNFNSKKILEQQYYLMVI